MVQEVGGEDEGDGGDAVWRCCLALVDASAHPGLVTGIPRS